MRPRFGSLVLVLVALGTGSGSLSAAATTTAAEEPEAIAEARRWQGRWCPTTGCGPPEAASVASIGGFAAAALGAVVLARRRR
jgi:MYXO-CTERM domain-containing protein